MKRLILSIILLIFFVSTVFANTEPLIFKIIRIEELKGMVVVKVKITNNSDKYIDQAYVTCVLLDDKENEISFKSHYIIKSTEVGLAPGRDTYFDYIINVPDVKTKSIKWHIENIIFK